MLILHITSNSPLQLCVSIRGISTIQCSEIIAGWLELPLHLTGLQVVSFAIYLHQHLSLTYYIHEVVLNY